ncbi:MAG: DUF1802 family protein, partial [Verrucomicrobiia bacterium]
MIPGFKEWSLVCSALLRGDTALILRKGGIAEDAGSFAFTHPSFLLIPTRYHAAAEKWRWTTPDLSDVLLPDQPLLLHAYADLIATRTLHHWDTVLRLEPFHGWTRDVLLERFNYADAGAIHAAILRVHRIQPPWNLPYDPAYAGCKSWIDLPDPPQPFTPQPVLPDAA